MNKKIVEMVFMSLVTAFGIIGICCLASCMLKMPDNPVEEAVEVAIESILEDHFNLPPDTLDIDLTPETKEIKP